MVLEVETTVTLSDTLNRPLIRAQGIPPKEVVRIIREMVLMTAKAFKYSEKMDVATGTLIASDLYDAFKYEAFEDIILMLKMARRGELGSGKGRFDHDILFNLFIPAYLRLKAEEREKIIHNERKLKQTAEPSEADKEIFAENVRKLDKLLSKLTTKTKPSEPAPVNHHALFIEKLPGWVQDMSNGQLKTEMAKAKRDGLMDAYEIYKDEIKKRGLK